MVLYNETYNTLKISQALCIYKVFSHEYYQNCLSFIDMLHIVLPQK